MSLIAREMLENAITAFVDQDDEIARRVATRDDEVDVLHEQVVRDLMTSMMADPDTIHRATHLLWASHNIERIADRVTNICERVVFAVTGEIVELGGGRKKRQKARKLAESASGVSG
jgi:phosphate transport system protein